MSALTNEQKVNEAIRHLRDARDWLARAGSKRTLERVRSALKSAEGARRHARHKTVMADWEGA